MATQKPWTIYEAAILLDGFLQFSEGTVSRKQAISNVSTKLRQIAINQDEIIDEIYRNINGITFQMASLESAYRGHTVMKPPTRLFAEIVSIYKTDQTRYQKIWRMQWLCAVIKKRTMPSTMLHGYHQK